MIIDPTLSGCEKALKFVAEYSLPVVPVKPKGKAPSTKNGATDATAEPDRIIQLFKRRSKDSNYAVRLGTNLGIDVDSEEGDRVLDKLQTRHGELPRTLKVQTSESYKYHLYFNAGRVFTSRVRSLPGIDIRSGNTVLIGPGSIHKSGAVYEIVDDAPIAELPDWLANILDPQGADEDDLYVVSMDYSLATHPGCEAPGRHDLLIKLVGAEIEADSSDLEIMKLASEFNSRCTPPKEKRIIHKDVRDCLRRYRKSAQDAITQKKGRRLKLQSVADVRFEKMHWLWPNVLPIGHIGMLSGDPGCGKGCTIADICARLSKGMPWPISSSGSAPLASSILIQSEDHPGQTVKPRLMAAGANQRLIAVTSTVELFDTKKVSFFSLKKHVSELAAAITSWTQTTGVNCRFVCIDPVSSFMGSDTDTYRNSDVRSVLQPITDMAQQLNVLILMVSHNSKDNSRKVASHKVMDSLAFAAASRVVWSVFKDKTDEQRRLWLPAKFNLAKDSAGLAYTVEPSEWNEDYPVVKWESEFIDMTADTYLNEKSQDASPAVAGAMQFLTTVLKDGPRLVQDLAEECKTAGVSWRSCERASGLLPITKRPQGKARSPWVWELNLHEIEL